MSDVIEIGKEQAVALLERAVAEKGADYEYQPVPHPNRGTQCQYQFDGAPSCIVGHALVYAGVPVETLVKLDKADEWWNEEHEAADNIDDEERDWHYVDATDIETLADAGVLTEVAGIRLTPEAEKIFLAAQQKQDSKVQWGKAVEAAKALVVSD
jgi:hypothetical protein